MATIKSYTDIEQSKKLAEILPIESVDNLIVSIGYNDGVKTVTMPKAALDIIKTPFSDIRKIIPCWSLSALLNVLPNGTDVVKEEADTENERYMCTVGINDDIISTFANNPVDACYEMVLKLHKLKVL